MSKSIEQQLRIAIFELRLIADSKDKRAARLRSIACQALTDIGEECVSNHTSVSDQQRLDVLESLDMRHHDLTGDYFVRINGQKFARRSLRDLADLVMRSPEYSTKAAKVSP